MQIVLVVLRAVLLTSAISVEGHNCEACGRNIETRGRNKCKPFPILHPFLQPTFYNMCNVMFH
jgi:hypothetical protein